MYINERTKLMHLHGMNFRREIVDLSTWQYFFRTMAVGDDQVG